MSSMSTEAPWLAVRESARRVGVHENTIRRWADRGLVESVKLLTGVRRPLARDVDRLAERAAVPSARPAAPLDAPDTTIGATPCATFVTVGELYKGAEHARWGESRIAGLERCRTNDAWIAACCLVHQASLATLNVRHFDQVPGLRPVTAE